MKTHVENIPENDSGTEEESQRQSPQGQGPEGPNLAEYMKQQQTSDTRSGEGPDSDAGLAASSPPEEASAKPGGETLSGETERNRREFFENIVLQPEDVGKTLTRKIDEAQSSADNLTELSPTESQFLDDMIFKGYVDHTIYLREDFPVIFRSASTQALQRGWEMLTDETGTEQYLRNLRSSMVLAVYLVQYGTGDGDSLYFSQQSSSLQEFESEKQIKERYDFVINRINAVVVDTLSERLHEFLSLLRRIGKAQNIINF